MILGLERCERNGLLLSLGLDISWTVGGIGRVPMCARRERRAVRHAGHGLGGGWSADVLAGLVLGHLPGISLLRNIQHSVSGRRARSAKAMAKHVPGSVEPPSFMEPSFNGAGNVARTYEEGLLCSNCSLLYKGSECGKHFCRIGSTDSPETGWT